MHNSVFYEYVTCNQAELFTVICLPQSGGKFPTVIFRTPYVDAEETMTEAEICEAKQTYYSEWIDAGYAVVFQHCRGRGKSGGVCIPFVHEREDGLALQAWIREQSFYNGELY